MFWSKKEKPQSKTFDRENEAPVIRSSICNGEQVAGFKDKHSGQFREVMCIRTPEDKRMFLDEYGLKPEEVRKEY